MDRAKLGEGYLATLRMLVEEGLADINPSA